MLKHHRQEKGYSCGAASYKILLSDVVDITEKEARKECKTRCSGTADFNVLSALKKRGLDANQVWLGVDFEEYSRWLYLNSIRRKLYLSCHYIDRNDQNRGRDRHRLHAIVASNGFIYDPAETKPCPIEAYFDVYNKKLTIDAMILVDIS